MHSTTSRLLKVGFFAAVTAFAAPSFAALSLPITLNTTGINANSVLTLTQDAFDTLDTASVHISAAGTAASKDALTFNLPITSLTVDLLSFKPTKGSAKGAELDVTRGNKSLSLANFTLDFTKNQVFADVTAGGSTFAQMAVYSFVLTQPLKLSLTGGITLTENVGSLTLTSGAADLFASTLGIAGNLKSILSSLDFGTLNNTITPTKRVAVTSAAAVPEPSTYALVGLGLGAAGMLARRRRAA